MNNPIIFTIQGLPPSYNKHFNINYNFREVTLSSKARWFKTKVKMSMPAITLPSKDSRFLLVITYHANWYYANGKPRIKDSHNLDKLLIDAICEKLGTDDSRLWGRIEWKEQATSKEYTKVKLFLI